MEKQREIVNWCCGEVLNFAGHFEVADEEQFRYQVPKGRIFILRDAQFYNDGRNDHPLAARLFDDHPGGTSHITFLSRFEPDERGLQQVCMAAGVRFDGGHSMRLFPAGFSGEPIRLWWFLSGHLIDA